MPTKKIFTIIGISLAVIIVIVVLLWFYQQQGVIKVFPTAEDRKIKRILIIDRSKFALAQGMGQDKLEEALKNMEAEKKKIEANPKDAAAWFQFGYLKSLLNDHAGAVGAWEQAFKLQDLNFVTAANLADKYHYFLKDYPKAETYYRKALQIRPDLTTAYHGLLDLYRFNFTGHLDKFEPLALEAVQKDSQNALTYYNALVEFFATKGNDLTKAKSYLVKVEKLNKRVAGDLISAYPALRSF